MRQEIELYIRDENNELVLIRRDGVVEFFNGVEWCWYSSIFENKDWKALQPLTYLGKL